MLATSSRIALRARRAASFVLLTLTTALLGGCASGPQARSPYVVAEHDTVEVACVTEGKRLTLRNEAALSSAAYRDKGTYGNVESPDVKIADQATMQALIDALYDVGYFERAQADSGVGARTAVTVSWQGKRSTWNRPVVDPSRMDELQRFQTAQAAFLHVYSSIVSFHSSKMSGDDLSKTPEELERRNQEAVRNIQRKAATKGQ